MSFIHQTKINDVNYDIIGSCYYGTSSTAAGTAAKVATITNADGFVLTPGATVAIKFTTANSVSSPTLNVNSTGDIGIRYRGAAITSSTYYWSANQVITFVYDGNYWHITVTLEDIPIPQKIALVATAGQTSFTIPFDYDSLSSNLTVYFNGILMKETDNYTVDTTNNTVNLVDFSAEAGDIITIMGLLGAQSIDFGQEAIEAINQINNAVTDAQTQINQTVQSAMNSIDAKTTEAEQTINNLVDQLPSDWDQFMNKSISNQMGTNGKIVMASSYTPSNDYDVATKKYVDNNMPSTFTSSAAGVVPASGGGTTKYLRADGTWATVTPAVGTSTDYMIYIGSSTPANGTTPLLWIDTTSNTGVFKYRTSTTGTWTTVPVAWS